MIKIIPAGLSGGLFFWSFLKQLQFFVFFGILCEKEEEEKARIVPTFAKCYGGQAGVECCPDMRSI